MDRGDDFAMLREMLAQPQGEGGGYGVKEQRHGSKDSGYFSRRGSKAVSMGGGRREEGFMEEMRGISEGGESEGDEGEEADDEGIEYGAGGGKQDDGRGTVHVPRDTQTMTPEHVDQIHSQMRMGGRFGGVGRREEMGKSADEGVGDTW